MRTRLFQALVAFGVTLGTASCGSADPAGTTAGELEHDAVAADDAPDARHDDIGTDSHVDEDTTPVDTAPWDTGSHLETGSVADSGVATDSGVHFDTGISDATAGDVLTDDAFDTGWHPTK